MMVDNDEPNEAGKANVCTPQRSTQALIYDKHKPCDGGRNVNHGSISQSTQHLFSSLQRKETGIRGLKRTRAIFRT